MSYTLVAEKPEVFRAAASVIGTMSGYTWEHRDMIRPVPILQISGLDDEVIPYDGSMPPAGGWGGAPRQDVIIDFWSKLNQTKAAAVEELSSQTTAHYYKDGGGSQARCLYTGPGTRRTEAQDGRVDDRLSGAMGTAPRCDWDDRRGSL